MIFSIECFTAANGVRLRYGFTRPAHVRAYVLILQGLGEFIERYEETARELAMRDLGCVTFDFRGQGFSERMAAQHNIYHIDDLGEYCVETREVMEHVRERLGIETDLLLSHSTGGLVAMKMLAAAPGTWRSAVMIAPFFGLGGPDWLVFGARFLSRVLCRLGLARYYLPRQRDFSDLAGLNRLMIVAKFLSGGWSRSSSAGRYSSSLRPFDPDNLLTSDETRYARNVAYLNDHPELFVGGISAGWLAACFHAQKALLRRKAGALALRAVLPPITMVLAGEDRIVNNRKTKAMFADNPAVTITEIPAARHEILQERDCFRTQFWAAFDRHVGRCHAW